MSDVLDLEGVLAEINTSLRRLSARGSDRTARRGNLWGSRTASA